LIFHQVDFIQTVMGFAEGLNQMSMNDSEMALFSAAVLLSPDRPVINDAKGIAQYQERITDALRLQVRLFFSFFTVLFCRNYYF
jgi:hypothetical protein